jgi:5-methylthioadenosine/S-adenosylhomocysteine deaminase
MTGLYNLHTHTPMTLLRGLGSNLPLDRWLHEAMFPVEARLTPADISAGSRLAMMEMLASGVVSFSDMYDMTPVTADEVIKAGMKANLNRPILGFDPDETYQASTRRIESLDFYDQYNGAGGGRIIADFAIHAEYTSYEHLVKPYAADCLRRSARMHLHLSETVKEHEACKARYGKTPTRWFLDLGVLDNPVTAAHCVTVESADIDILVRQGVTCVHNPTSNMKLGCGFMPLQTMLERGINVAIGTDGAASNNNLNLFEEIHLASLIHKGFAGDPTLIRPDELLKMATLNGARGQGRADCGELAVGRKADLIAIDLGRPHLMPVHDLAALLVYSAQGADVVMTMVDGSILYDHGTFTTIDMDELRRDLDVSTSRLFKTG